MDEAQSHANDVETPALPSIAMRYSARLRRWRPKSCGS